MKEKPKNVILERLKELGVEVTVEEHIVWDYEEDSFGDWHFECGTNFGRKEEK